MWPLLGKFMKLINHAFFFFIDVNECISNPCQNGGRCIDLRRHYSCQCPEGRTGYNCQVCKSFHNVWSQWMWFPHSKPNPSFVIALWTWFILIEGSLIACLGEGITDKFSSWDEISLCNKEKKFQCYFQTSCTYQRISCTASLFQLSQHILTKRIVS